MSNALRTEQVSVAHAEILSALHGRCFSEAWSPESMASLFATPGMLGVIATDSASDQPVGFVLMRAIDGEAEILTIGVLPEARGTGIGTFLLGIMLEEGISTVFLDVAEDNEAALRLYRSSEFEVVGRRAAYYKREDGTRVDSLTMKRVVG